MPLLTINAIALIAMIKYVIDGYVVDVLLPDLVGHDRKPAAYLVYLFLLCTSERTDKASVAISLQDIAVRTGLAKSTVQAAIRHLKSRGLIDAKTVASTTRPIRRVLKPWVK
jgi:DNA-binding MarR family transcriptional regulator